MIKKILIIRLTSLGDIIHTYPMVYDIKNNIKNAKIDWLVDERFASIIQLNPLVNRVVSIPLREWKQNKLLFIFKLIKWIKNLKHIKYDYIIDSQGLIKSALLSKYFIGVRYGFDKKSVREKLACLFYDRTFNINNNQLAIFKNRELASKIFDYKISDTINFGIKQSFPILNDYNYRYIIFFHSCSSEKKKYPINLFAELANKLVNHNNIFIILPYGNLNEKKQSILIQNQVTRKEQIIIPPKIFSFSELHSLIYHAEFIFGVDTGLTHLANALNKPLIAIFTYTDPKKTGIIESNIAKNIGSNQNSPTVDTLVNIYKNLINP